MFQKLSAHITLFVCNKSLYVILCAVYIQQLLAHVLAYNNLLSCYLPPTFEAAHAARDPAYVLYVLQLRPVTQLYVSVDAATPETLKAVDRPLFADYW